MSVKILIKEVDEFGSATFRECCITSRKLQSKLYPQWGGKVEVIGAIWDNEPLSVDEAVRRNFDKFKHSLSKDNGNNNP